MSRPREHNQQLAGVLLDAAERRIAADGVDAGLVFRRFALEHPALYSVAFHRASAAVWPLFRDAASEAFGALQLWFEPLAALGLLGDRTAADAALQFDALCEGIAWMELRGNPLRPDPTPLRTRRQHPDRRRPDLVQTPDTPPTARPGP